MASPPSLPVQTNGALPTTPPPSDSSTTNNPPSKQPPVQDPDVPLTSTHQQKLPRDARLIHTVLQNLGCTSYQERVPLQLLDFAYRYTSSILSDSLRLSAEGYSSAATQGTGKRGGGADKGDEGERITVTALRQAIASRQGLEFGGAIGKDFLLAQAGERNRVALPRVERGYGVQLPEEKYCLTGVGWGMKGSWDSESEEDEEEAVEGGNTGVNGRVGEDERMGGTGREDGEGEGDEDEEGAGRMEDVFGDGEAAAEDGDEIMRED